MLYTTKILTKMLNDSFVFPYNSDMFTNSYVYDEMSVDKDGNCKITVLVPGFSKDNLELSISDETLSLKDNEDKKVKKFWKLSEYVDIKNIKAECKNGILTINIPPKEKINTKHTITIL